MYLRAAYEWYRYSFVLHGKQWRKFYSNQCSFSGENRWKLAFVTTALNLDRDRGWIFNWHLMRSTGKPFSWRLRKHAKRAIHKQFSSCSVVLVKKQCESWFFCSMNLIKVGEISNSLYSVSTVIYGCNFFSRKAAHTMVRNWPKQVCPKYSWQLGSLCEKCWLPGMWHDNMQRYKCKYYNWITQLRTLTSVVWLLFFCSPWFFYAAILWSKTSRIWFLWQKLFDLFQCDSAMCHV